MKAPTEEVGSPAPAVHVQIKHVPIGDSGVLGSSWYVWVRSQFGQNEVIRWSVWREEYPELRRQTLAEHIFSLSCLVEEKAEAMEAAGYPLDRGLLTDCTRTHDVGEQLLGVDVAAPRKCDLDDLKEYLAFKQVFELLGEPTWPQLQQAFLLQTCIKNPECFPSREREIMKRLAATKRNEALFFRGMEVFDYLYYAYEGWASHGIEEILGGVASHHLKTMDGIARELPGFGQVVWTPGIRSFFASAAASYKGNGGSPLKRQLELFEA